MQRTAHRLAASDVTRQEHALAEGHRALDEVLGRERSAQQDRQTARGDAVALDRVLDEARVERHLLAAVVALRQDAHRALARLEDDARDLALRLERRDLLVEDALERGVRAEGVLVLEEARHPEDAVAHGGHGERRARAREQRRRDERPRGEEVDDDVLRQVEREARSGGTT